MVDINVFSSTFTKVFFVTFFTFLTVLKYFLNVFLHLWSKRIYSAIAKESEARDGRDY